MTSHGDVAQWLSRHKLQLVYVVVLKCVIYKKKKKKIKNVSLYCHLLQFVCFVLSFVGECD